MGKHQKRLREEKSKVKLKKTPLPKGQNVTDTSFKVKRIALIEQLPQHEGEPRTSNNHTLKELLNTLHHHNSKTQMSSIIGLKELFLNYAELGQGLDLMKVVSRVVDLVIDADEGKIRKAACALLSAIILPLADEKKPPLVDLLYRQILRGLSHLQPGVQKDTLQLLDLFLEIIPDSWPVQGLLGPLVRFLSLASDLDRRLNVLNRIYAVFLKMTNQSESKDSIRQIHFTDRVGPLTGIYKSIPRLSMKSNQVGDDIKKILAVFMPILISIWLEISSKNLNAISGRLLTQLGRGFVLTTKLIDDFHDKPDFSTLKNWFVGEFKVKIYKVLFEQFPFSYSDVEENQGNRQADFHQDTIRGLKELNKNCICVYRWFNSRQKYVEIKISRYEEERKRREERRHN